MNTLLDNLFARRPKIHYVCPPICGVQFVPTSSGAPAVSFDPISPLGCVDYAIVNSTLNWNAFPGAICYNVYYASPEPVTMACSSTFILLDSCTTKNALALSEPGCYLVTAVTADGETPFCTPVELTTTPIPPTPPLPPTPITECVKYYLTNTTATTSDFTWASVIDAISYNVYAAPSADPTNFSLIYTGLPAPATYPIDCQLIKVSAVGEAGEGPVNCAPIEFCYTPCWDMLPAPGALPASVINKALSISFVTSGGVGVPTFSGTNLPDGLVLTTVGDNHVTLSGTPTTAGTFDFSITAEYGGHSCTYIYSLEIWASCPVGAFPRLGLDETLDIGDPCTAGYPSSGAFEIRTCQRYVYVINNNLNDPTVCPGGCGNVLMQFKAFNGAGAEVASWVAANYAPFFPVMGQYLSIPAQAPGDNPYTFTVTATPNPCMP